MRLTRSRAGLIFLGGLFTTAVLSPQAGAADWPTWRGDAARTASISDSLPEQLHPEWTRKLPEPAPAWPPDQGTLLFDIGNEPITAGGLVIVPSNRTDSVTAYDAASGEEKWRFSANGPVRFAPVVGEGKVFFNSDDGCLYALELDTGELLWKFQGAPKDNRLLGNQRLISMWPARGGAVYEDGTVYFAAGIWPFMGVFIHAVDAATGKARWSNSGVGSSYITQPHSSPAFAGIAPQGYMAVSGDHLLVAGGRTVPAAFAKSTGDLLYYEANHGKMTGGYSVLAGKNWFLNHDILFDLESGALAERGLNRADLPVIEGDLAYTLADGKLIARSILIDHTIKKDRRGNEEKVFDGWKDPAWEAALEGPLSELHFKAGDRLYASGPEGRVAAISVAEDRRGKVVWEATVPGSVWRLVPGQNRLFAMTLEGTLHSFGADQAGPVRHDLPTPDSTPSEEARQQARSLLTQAGNREGYALLLGLEDGNLASALVAESDFHLIAIDSDPERVRLFRDRMVAAGLYGDRASAIVADPMTAQLPAYMAHAIFSENLERAGLDQGRAFVEVAFHSLRPYGGAAVFQLGSEAHKAAFEQAYQAASLENPSIQYTEEGVVLSRPGALPDTDSWTNQYGDPSNSVVSSDSRVKAPLGLLWFGGPSNQGVLPRHGHGPTQQVVDGRLFIEGPDMIRAVDVYTGRLLWETSLPGVGAIYDNTAHQPGANSVGSNYVSTSDTLYVAYGDVGVCLDPVDGSVKNQFTIPAKDDPARHDHWGFLNTDGDVLLVATSPVDFDSDVYFVEDEFRKLEEEQWKEMAQWVNTAAGANLDESDEEEIIEAFNKLLTTPDLLNNLPDNPAALAATEQVRERIKKHLESRTNPSSEDIVLAKLNRELIVPFVPGIRARTIAVGDWIFSGVSSQRLVALDRRSGEILWSKDAKNAFVHNTVILGGGKAFAIDRLPLSEVQHLQRRGKSPEKEFRIVAWDAKTGEELWSTHEGIFGTWLSYSAEHDLLLQAGRASRDMLPEPDDQLTVYNATDGSVKWHKEIEYGGPCMLHGDTLITQGFALDLLTGEPKMRTHPLTGEQVPWTFERNYGCNSAVASEHLLTFRSAAAGFFDLARDGGTGNIGGFRSGCTTNLIVADGVLNAPDYTRTCICAYQLQTSLALVHMPELEMWTFNPMDKAEVPIKQVGLNFGAPGDRMADDGLLWLDYPSVGGPSPDVPVTVKDEGVKWFRRNALELGDEGQGQGWKWVASSGAEGLDEINVRLASGWTKERKYTVRLHFADFDSTNPGERVFDVELQGKKVLEDLDIVGEVGPKVSLVKEFKGIEIGNDLSLRLTKNNSEGGREPLLSGLEIRAEEE